MEPQSKALLWQACRFAVVSPLPKEFAAMCALLEDPQPVSVQGDPNDYSIGFIPARDGLGKHAVLVAMQKKPANNTAAAVVSHIPRSFPNVEAVLVVGIAGGIPNPKSPENHVRLGDVVVSNYYGVLQYDHLKVDPHHIEIRTAAAPPSAQLLGYVNRLTSEALLGKRPWEALIGSSRLAWVQRPGNETDRLYSSDEPEVEISHPEESGRVPGQPKIHVGMIASSNILLKDPKLRDLLRERRALAVEMEASGVADSTWMANLTYIVIRGVCDYCDTHKNDLWQGYSAFAAAAYSRSLIATIPFTPDAKAVENINSAQQKITDANHEALNNNCEKAAQLLDAAAELARSAGDPLLESRAVLGAAKLWGEFVAQSDLESEERREIISKVRDYIERLRQLGQPPAVVALETAQINRLDGDPHDTFRLSQEALSLAGDDPALRSEALIACLQACWQLGSLEKALAFASDVADLREQTHKENKLALEANWLRTICKAGRLQDADVEGLTGTVREVLSEAPELRRYASLVLNEVANEFNRGRNMAQARKVSELAYEVCAELEDPRLLSGIALHISELSAEMGEAEQATLYLGRADLWAGRQVSAPAAGVDSPETARVSFLFSRARILTRIADKTSEPDEALYQKAFEALKATHAYATEHRTKLRGDIETYLADISWWLGRTALNLGRNREAVEFLRNARSEAAISNPRFAAEIGAKAWLMEAESLVLSGRISDGCQAAQDMSIHPAVPTDAKNRALQFKQFVERTILPTADWFSSAEAGAISETCKKIGLRDSIAQQLTPLISWWKDWHGEGDNSPDSELLDFWGRGGFARVAAALRSQPHRAIATDAWSVEDVRKWARVFCPLFDTVVVKWKGELGAGLMMTPLHVNYGGEGSFGGHGYEVTSSLFQDKPYTVAMSWANPLPRPLAFFLAGEALPLVKAGRLLVVPAPLVGCTQSSIGWTDDLFIEGLLAGVVNVARKHHGGERLSNPRPQRILDLTSIQLPFIDHVAMADLAKVLEETDQWIGPLRALIMRTLVNRDLNFERWEPISALQYDIEEACREFREHLKSLVSKQQALPWTVADAIGGLSTGSRGVTPKFSEPVTGLLQAVASSRSDLAPWIPFWCLQECGGHIDWTCPLDNPSTQPPEQALAQLPPKAHRSDLQTWLYPGTGGWGVRHVVRLEPV